MTNALPGLLGSLWEAGRDIMDDNRLADSGMKFEPQDLGIPDFEYPHIVTLHQRNMEGRFVMKCVCGDAHAITGLGWLQWMERHAKCVDRIAGADQTDIGFPAREDGP